MKHTLRNLTYAAMSLALCLVLPFFTGQIPQIGAMLCPMHLPVLLAGFLCGPAWAGAVGLLAPLSRHILFHMPPLVTALGMTVELTTYGIVSGLLARRQPKTAAGTYTALIAAMVAGRVLWGCAMVGILGLSGSAFTWSASVAGAVLNAIPGIILQLILIPLLVSGLRRAKIIA